MLLQHDALCTKQKEETSESEFMWPSGIFIYSTFIHDNSTLLILLREKNIKLKKSSRVAPQAFSLKQEIQKINIIYTYIGLGT